MRLQAAGSVSYTHLDVYKRQAGHSDTVPFDAALWQTDPLKLSEVGDRWVGLGSCDMKGFFALAIEAVRPLLDQPFQQPLLILATCDEESSMAGARALAAAGRPLGRAAVIGEPTGLKPIRLHKGVMMERIDLSLIHIYVYKRQTWAMPRTAARLTS